MKQSTVLIVAAAALAAYYIFKKNGGNLSGLFAGAKPVTQPAAPLPGATSAGGLTAPANWSTYLQSLETGAITYVGSQLGLNGAAASGGAIPPASGVAPGGGGAAVAAGTTTGTGSNNSTANPSDNYTPGLDPTDTSGDPTFGGDFVQSSWPS